MSGIPRRSVDGFAVDLVSERLRLAREHSRAETVNYLEADIVEALKEMTGGRGPDACIDAVGMEAHPAGPVGLSDKRMQQLRVESGRPIALRLAIQSVRKGGTVSVAGVYGGFADNIPMGAVMNKALTIRSGQTHVQRYLRPLLDRIQRGEIDPSFVITHTEPLEAGPQMYRIFRDKLDGCIKVVMRPWG